MLDHDLCDQVFTNLFMNACEAMGEDGGDLSVRLRASDEKNERARRCSGD